MAIDIRNLVNVNIEPYTSTLDSGSRPIALIYGGTTKYEASSLADVVSAGIKENTLEYNGAKLFFENGGIKLKAVGSNLPTKASDLMTKDLLENVIIINIGTANTYTEDDFKKSGIYKKIIIEGGTSVPTTSKSFTAYKIENSATSGERYLIGAYLSKIKVYNESSIKDYSMTLESGTLADVSSKITTTSGTSLESLAYNFDMLIGGNYYNIGGNCTDGSDLVNNFVTIVLEQTTTNVLFRTLSAKLKGQTGLSAIRTAISSELDKYVYSGFLATNKVWTDEDLVISSAVGGADEVVITKNTPLSSGYHIHLFKLSSSERSAYAFLILPTSKGIRYIKVDGYSL